MHRPAGSRRILLEIPPGIWYKHIQWSVGFRFDILRATIFVKDLGEQPCAGALFSGIWKGRKSMCKRSVRIVSCLLVLSLVGVTLGDLIGQWKFDEGSSNVAKDSSGKGHDGKLLGVPAWGSGPTGLGTAVVFDPTACTGVDCGVFDPTNGKGKFSLAFWAFWDGTGTFQHFFTKSNGWGTTTMMFQVELWGAHTTATYTDRVGISFDPASVPFSVMPKNEWAHLAFVFDGTNLRLYLNGIDEEGPKALTIGPNVPAKALIGVDYDGGRVFHGSLDDVRLYDHALTAVEVEVLCPPSRAAKSPNPANGATGVQTPLFRWEAGYKASLHEVYLGTTPDLGPADLAGPRTPVAMLWYIPGLKPGTTYYWRVDEVEADGKTINKGVLWSFTTQAVTAYLPSPADKATDIAPAPTLVWQPGQLATKHHLYLSTSLDAVTQAAAGADKGLLTDATFTPGPLDSVTTYYWRVDETVADGSIKTGPVWSFTTHLPVDDFESYTDAEGSRIYETWIDGLTNSTGSLVGYMTAPFAEQKIVHGGKQSMPLDYNNVKSPYYSEAEQTWAKAQDWTAGGMEVLVLNLRGVATNTAGPIYVAVKDSGGRTGVVTHPDANAFRATNWLTWKIPLSDLTAAGVKVTAVKTLYLGVGNRTAPKANGAGRLFIDDIRVTKP